MLYTNNPFVIQTITFSPEYIQVKKKITIIKRTLITKITGRLSLSTAGSAYRKWLMKTKGKTLRKTS